MRSCRKTLVGLDGCKAGWIGVVGDDVASADLQLFENFEAVLTAYPRAMIAVDMPIGLPERITGGGRAPEKCVRPMLGARQSSVFAIPARAAVEMGAAISGIQSEDIALHKQTSALAKTRSDPAKGVSIQAFYLFPKILQIDRLLQKKPDFRDQVFECHPEVAFTVLGDGQAMKLPKKVKGKINEPGMDERRALLARFGLQASFLTNKPPTGVGLDDVLDAAVCWLVAQRLMNGQAVSFPSDPPKDAHGIEMAIWA